MAAPTSPLRRSPVTQIDATHYKLEHFNDQFDAATGFDGTYVLTVNGATLRDLAGNAGTGTATSSWMLDISGPAAPTAVTLSPDTGASATDGITNTLNLAVAGTLASTGLTVRVTDMTNSTELGYATVTGTHFAANITLPGPGTHHLRVRAIDAAGNTADAFVDVFADTTATRRDRALRRRALAAHHARGIRSTSPSPRRSTPRRFTAAAVVLTRNGTSVPASGVTITALGNNVYRVGNLSALTGALGSYHFAVNGSLVHDIAGNAAVSALADDWSVTASVAVGFGGVVYEDANGDGAREFGPSVPSYDTQEQGLAGWTVYLDANNNGALDNGEERVVTGADGSYSFADLTAGSYVARVVTQTGYSLTGPVGGAFTVTVGADQYLTTSSDFGEFKLGTLSGTVFSDDNADGARNNGEAALAGWTVFLDLHGDNVLHSDDPSVVTAADGGFTFNGIGPGITRVAEVAKPGYGRTTPQTAVTVESGYAGQGLDIGNAQFATISGNVYNDTTGNAAREAADAGLPGWTVFIDANNDGELETTELSTTSDAAGNFSFTSLLPGKYTVRIIQQAGYQETSPATPDTAAGATASTAGFSTSGVDVPMEVDCTCGGTWSVQGGNRPRRPIGGRRQRPDRPDRGPHGLALLQLARPGSDHGGDRHRHRQQPSVLRRGDGDTRPRRSHRL